MEPFFKENQKLLLELANTEAGRLLLSKIGQKPTDQIVHITQNSFTELIGFDGKKPVLRATFYSRHPILTLFAPVIEKMKIVANSKYVDRYLENKYAAFLHYSGLQHNNRLPHILLNQSTFNPTTGSNSPVDGRARRAGVNEAFSTIRAGAGTDSFTTEASGNMFLTSSGTSNQYQEMVHWYFCFDTSTLTNAATISSAVFSLFGTNKANQLGSPDFHCAAANLAATNAIAASDFQNISRTSFGSVTYSNWNTAAYNDITLNASGVANINKTGVSQFSGQLSWDINNDTSGITWAGASSSAPSCDFADNGSNLPKLVVTYTSGGGAFLLNFV